MSKGRIDYSSIQKEIENLVLFVNLRKNIDLEDIEFFLNDEKGEKKGKIEVNKLKLKPDPPSFAGTKKEIELNRLNTEENEFNLENGLFIFDLFEIIQNNCLKQFGLQDISIEDLKRNNIHRALIIVNKKGEVTNIITNKSANKFFVDNLLLNNLKYGLDFKNKQKIE